MASIRVAQKILDPGEMVSGTHCRSPISFVAKDKDKLELVYCMRHGLKKMHDFQWNQETLFHLYGPNTILDWCGGNSRK